MSGDERFWIKSMYKTFRHKFSNGIEIELKFDLSKPDISCTSSMKIDSLPKEILEEYRVWQTTVVTPEILSGCTKEQLINLGKIGYKSIMEEIRG